MAKSNLKSSKTTIKRKTHQTCFDLNTLQMACFPGSDLLIDCWKGLFVSLTIKV